MKKIILFTVAIVSLFTSVALADTDGLFINKVFVNGSKITFYGEVSDVPLPLVGYFVKLAQGDEYYAVGHVMADENNKFSQSFTMYETSPGGTYEITAALPQSTKTCKASFEYISEEQRQIFTDSVMSLSAEEMVKKLTENDSLKFLEAMACQGIDFTELSDDKKLQCAKLIKSGLTGYYKLPITHNDFSLLFNYCVAYTYTTDKSFDTVEMLKKYADIFGIGDVTLENSDFLTGKIIAADDKSPADVKTAFTDAAVCIAFNEELDYKNVPKLLSDYSEQLNISLKDYNNLSSSSKTAVNKGILESDYKKISEVSKRFNDLVAKEQSSAAPAGGGGGGGGSSTTSNAAKPYTPMALTENEENDDKQKKFTDMGDFSWANEAVEALSNNGIISGSGNGEFSPGRNITREEFVKIIVLGFSLMDSDAACGFSDVDVSSWYYSYVSSGVKCGIVSGISTDEFGSGKFISREEIATLLFRVADHLSIVLEETKTGEFGDSQLISEYAREPVQRLYNSGIISGTTDQSFNPKNFATRAEAAKMVYGLWRIYAL